MILTVAITLSWFSLVIWLIGLAQDDLLTVMYQSWQWFLGHRGNESNIALTRIVVGTAFTTSIWLWLHGLAQLTIRSLNAFGSVFSWLNVKEKPIRAIGTTINVFVVTIGTVLFPLYLLMTK